MTQESTPKLGPLQRLRSVSPGAAEGFHEMRQAIYSHGPIDEKHRQLILLATYTVTRVEGTFKDHCKRALEAGATRAEIEQAVMMTLGSSQSLTPVAEALVWADDVIGGAG